MAYALVGAAGAVATGTGSAAPAFGQATSAGNLLIAWGTASLSGFTTTASGWVEASTRTSGTASVWYKANSAAGETAPSFTGSGTMFAALAEFSGGATSSPVDKIGNATGAGATPIVAANSAADTATGELFVTAALDILSKAGTVTTSETYNNGATPTTNLNNDATSTTTHYRFAWGTTTSSAAADQTSHADNSMNLSSTYIAVSSFLLVAVVARTPPFPSPTNFMDPGIF